MSPVSPDRVDLTDHVFSSGVSVTLRFAQPESAPMHFLAADNLGLARLFISKAFVDRYSRAAFSEALAALRPGHKKFVKAVLEYDPGIPGMTQLREAFNEREGCTLADRVALFAQGAVTLYAFAIAQGGTESGYNLSYVCEHIRVEAGTQQITEVIRQHMPYVIIKVLSEFTQRLKRLYSHESDDELCRQFWLAVAALDTARMRTEADSAWMHPAQDAVFQLILAYQKYRISQYQELYEEQVSALGDQKEAALACEKSLLDNGLL